MNAVILAAGYATRLYPLTKDFPKPLLKIGDRTILDLLVDQLETLDDLREIALVSNHRFAPLFDHWIQARGSKKMISLLDDGTVSLEDRLGALGDLRLALAGGLLADDLLVLAGDNVLRFPLAGLVRAFRQRKSPHICVHRVDDPQRLRRTGVAELDADNRVIAFAEKPGDPKTHWAVPPIYVLTREILPDVASHLSAAGNMDAPGHLIEWLCKRTAVFAHQIPGSILDVGTHESLDAARRLLLEPAP